MGYPATALWWPAMFPARPELPVNTLPGLGTPDIRGQLGVGTLFTSEEEKKKKARPKLPQMRSRIKVGKKRICPMEKVFFMAFDWR